MGTPVLMALEEFYAAPVEAVARELPSILARSRSTGASLEAVLDDMRCGEFLELYLAQVQAVPLEDWLDGLDEGEGTVRASIVGRDLATATAAQRRSLVIDGDHLGGDHLPLKGLPPEQVKAALCYANDVLAEDPFDEEQVIADFVSSIAESMPHVPIRVAPDPDHFVSSVRAVAALAPLIRAGHMTFMPRRLAMDARLSGRFASNAWDTFGARREELARRSLRLWLASGGLVTPLFGDPDEEEAFREEAGLLAPLTATQEALRVRRIAQLALPSTGRLEPNQMVRLREDDAFETFRARQRHALALVGDANDESARAAYRAEMAEAARALGKSISSRQSLNGLFTKAVGWGVGAMVVTPQGWWSAVAALGGITAEVVAERVVDRPGRAQKAMLHHYATLAAAP